MSELSDHSIETHIEVTLEDQAMSPSSLYDSLRKSCCVKKWPEDWLKTAERIFNEMVNTSRIRAVAKRPGSYTLSDTGIKHMYDSIDEAMKNREKEQD